MPSEKELLKILEKDTVDTSSWMVDDLKEAKYAMERAEGKLYSLATPQVDGTLRSYHVTDDPSKTVEILNSGGDFYAREGDLCGGLYVSTVPHFWEGRSERKWDFMKQLSREDFAKLIQAIRERIGDQIRSQYITVNEYENATGILRQAEEGYWPVLSIVANQPFNIDIPRMAKDLGLATPFEPHYVQVDFVGRYLEFNTSRAIEANEALLLLKHGSLEGLSRLDLCNMLKEYGWDGVFTKAGMGTNPELVIWSGDKILTFGDWVASDGAEMAGPKSRTVVFDPFGDQRFEADLSISRSVADIRDTKRNLIFPTFNRGTIYALRSTIARVLVEEEPIGFPAPVKKLLTGLDRNDLQNLFDLTDRLLELMR